MADRQTRSGGVQDTGNPVLDSTVNLASSMELRQFDHLRALHAIVLELAEAEPGGLMRRGSNGALKPSREGKPRKRIERSVES